MKPDTDAVDDEEEEMVDDEHAVHEMSPMKHTLLTAGIIGCGFTIAYFVSDLQLGKSFDLCVTPVMSFTPLPFSSVVRRVHRVYDDFIHPPWTILLAGAYSGFFAPLDKVR